MSELIINSPAGVNLADNTRHSNNVKASTVTPTMFELKFTDGWTVVSYGAFEDGYNALHLGGVATSFQVFAPGHDLQYSASFDGIDAAQLALFAGAGSVIAGFGALQSLVFPRTTRMVPPRSSSVAAATIPSTPSSRRTCN